MLQARLDYINLYQCENGFTTKERVFTFPYLLYVHQGKGNYKIGSITYLGTRGNLFFCPAGTGNTIMADGDEPFLLTGIDFRICGGDQPLEPLHSQTSVLANTFLTSLINRMISEYQLNRIGAGEICNTLLTAMLLELIRDAQAVQSERSNIQLAMLEYLKISSGRIIDCAEMAEAFVYHKSSINRLMVAATGQSLREYQISTRIRMAAELLAYSNRPLKEIAALCGYNSPIFFSRQFQEKTGQSPKDYRRSRQH